MKKWIKNYKKVVYLDNDVHKLEGKNNVYVLLLRSGYYIRLNSNEKESFTTNLHAPKYLKFLDIS